jgi:hypothetical protein
MSKTAGCRGGRKTSNSSFRGALDRRFHLVESRFYECRESGSGSLEKPPKKPIYSIA